MDEMVYNFTQDSLSKAFEQWLADYKENKVKKTGKFSKGYPDDNHEYGDDCAETMLEYLSEL